jgi:hypothetical protein
MGVLNHSSNRQDNESAEATSATGQVALSAANLFSAKVRGLRFFRAAAVGGAQRRSLCDLPGEGGSDAYFSINALVELVLSITSLMRLSVQSKGMSATFGF